MCVSLCVCVCVYIRLLTVSVCLSVCLPYLSDCVPASLPVHQTDCLSAYRSPCLPSCVSMPTILLVIMHASVSRLAAPSRSSQTGCHLLAPFSTFQNLPALFRTFQHLSDKLNWFCLNYIMSPVWLNDHSPDLSVSVFALSLKSGQTSLFPYTEQSHKTTHYTHFPFVCR